MILTSKNNPLIKETAALKEKKGRKQMGLFLVEGVKMARECFKSELETERVFLAESFVGELPFAEEKTVRVSDDVFRFLSDEKTPQGVLCRVKIPALPLESPRKSCLFLDGVADPGNLGTIVRTANAAGYKEIYLTETCADPYSPKSVRASMSGVFFTKLYTGTRAEILSVLDGTPVIAADMHGENAFSFVAPEKFALAIGNEANGISEETFKRANFTVKIPMESTQESLNAAVSAGILMYLLKKGKFKD
ncbi:MAG: RNA methyltransferase [Clostridia bacterium]|nr:RNA methyltransferase [Clostridia bacterium]